MIGEVHFWVGRVCFWQVGASVSMMAVCWYCFAADKAFFAKRRCKDTTFFPPVQIKKL
jgi:hypothetical protein